jgi:hypothetical protein
MQKHPLSLERRAVRFGCIPFEFCVPMSPNVCIRSLALAGVLTCRFQGQGCRRASFCAIYECFVPAAAFTRAARGSDAACFAGCVSGVVLGNTSLQKN